MSRNPRIDSNLLSMYQAQAQSLLLNLHRAHNQLCSQIPHPDARNSTTANISTVSRNQLILLSRSVNSIQYIVNDLNRCLTDSLTLEQQDKAYKPTKPQD